MIRFLSPGFAWMLAAPAVVVALYLLRRRFLPRQVPSVILWRRSVHDYAANRPFQRLMKNLLLPLQVLAALVLALVLMNPVLPGGTAGKSVFIFDVSGSMQAESKGKSRLELAREEALRRIRELPAEEDITVITAGNEVQRILLSGNKEEAEKAIASITCGYEGADFDRALTLAYALEQDAKVTIFSDALRVSEIHTPKGKNIPSVINTGEEAENRTVYSLTAENGKAYARVANFGKDCTVTLTCEADGTLCGASEITIPAGKTEGVSFELPEGTQKVRVSIREKDALAADNTAETTVKQTKSLKAAVTEESIFLESALKVRPDLTVMRTAAGALSTAEADLYILGSDPMIITTQKPEGVFDPAATAFSVFSWEADPSSPAGTEAEGNGTTEEPAAEIEEGPLTAGLTLKNIYFRSWHPITGGRTAVSLGGDAVIAWTEDTVILGFDLHDTNLPLKYDFPVLIQNTLNMLLGEEKTFEETAGNLISLAESDTRDTAPNAETTENKTGSEQGRELRSILLILFMILLAAEMGVARYVC